MKFDIGKHVWNQHLSPKISSIQSANTSKPNEPLPRIGTEIRTLARANTELRIGSLHEYPRNRDDMDNHGITFTQSHRNKRKDSSVLHFLPALGFTSDSTFHSPFFYY